MGIQGAVLGMLFCIMGHCFPVFYGFHGGKGILCAGGGLIVVDPRIFVVLLGVFVVALVLSRYVSLGSLLCAVSEPVWIYIFCEHNLTATLLGVVAAVLMIYMLGPIFSVW